MRIRLQEISRDSQSELRDFVAFVNAHYASPLPIDEAGLLGSSSVYFWALDEATGARIGTTGYVRRTPFLAESVKTVLAAEQRGKGLGPALSQAIEDEVRCRGFKKIMTTIYVTNLPMILIKLKQGYLIEGTHFDHEKPGLHEYSLGKRL